MNENISNRNQKHLFKLSVNDIEIPLLNENSIVFEIFGISKNFPQAKFPLFSCSLHLSVKPTKTFDVEFLSKTKL